MKLKNYILFLQLSLLTPAFAGVDVLSAAPNGQPNTENEQQLSGMTIFNSDNFYSQDNAISVHNGFTTVLKSTQTAAVIAFNSTPSLEFTDFNYIKPLKITRKLPSLQVTKQSVAVQKPDTSTPQLIGWGNLPFGNSSFYIGVNNSCGVVPTTSNNKQINALCPAEYFDFAQYKLRRSTKKQAIPSLEIVFISSNYSKTSRIRPPPTT